jgi:CubicO group peptidase (beta-lactamase class C family)
MANILFLFGALLFVRAEGSPGDTIRQIDELISTLHAQGDFNGSILVAINEKPIYSKGFGMANFKAGEKFTPATASCIASLTKQFTAMGIMKLAEQKKLAYDDPVTKYLRNLPACYQMVSLRHLLNHTSGVFDYDQLGSGSPDKLIFKKNSLRFQPGEKYEYSNSNYVLLSLIIETLSGISFADFLQRNFFTPLEMTRTFAYAHSNQKVPGVARGYNQFGKDDDYNSPATFGDGGIYSSAEDLLKWHQALRTEKLVKQSTLDMAFTAGKVRSGSSTYGFGWNVSEDAHGRFAWHTGNTSGFRAYMQHRLDERIDIIILTNTGHSRRVEIARAINNILHGEPFTNLKKSAAKKMYTIIQHKGIDEALLFYDSIHQRQADGDYDFSETEFNLLGYELLNSERKIDEAIAIFKANTQLYPTSSNTFDSLGEAYLKKGDKDSARNSYLRALELDPTNLNAARVLEKLR